MSLEMENLRSKLYQIEIPREDSQIFKEECVVSFENASSKNGLFIDMKSFKAFGKDYVLWNYEKTGNSIYLRILKKLKEKSMVEGEPKVLGIGVEGGFQLSKEEYEDDYSIVLLPDFEEFPFPDENLPEKVILSASALISSDSSEFKESLKAWVADEEKKESRFARDLVQLSNGVTVPPSPQLWKCSHTECPKRDNLWLNLSDGSLLCGRKNWDGSGGNGHALDHFKRTSFPLAVKMGTITRDLREADVYSYAEDEPVLDPFLDKHLAHFGIDFSSLEKTEKTTAEAELEQNLSFDFSRIQEAGKNLKPLFGPGFTGIHNLGNSCYMASIIQALFATPHFQERFFSTSTLKEAFLRAPEDISTDLNFQLVKVAHGLLSGKYSITPPESEQRGGEDSSSNEKLSPGNGISIRSFKSLIGKGHPEFSTSRQQDALEFFFYLLEKLDTLQGSGPSASSPSVPPSPFTFLLQDRLQCEASGQVRYTTRTDNVLSLPIPLSEATNAEEVQAYKKLKKEKEEAGEQLSPSKEVRPQVPLSACLSTLLSEEPIVGFFSPATKAHGPASRSSSILTFPDVLVLHMRRYILEEGGGWVPKKLDVLLDVPESLDLEFLKGQEGPKEGEKLLPEDTPPSSPTAPRPPPPPPPADPLIVCQLSDMGFPWALCEKAVLATGGVGVEEAMTWLLSHMDSEHESTVQVQAPSGTVPSAAKFTMSEEHLTTLLSFGFSRTAAENGLRAEAGDLERAANWIMSHPEEAENPNFFAEEVGQGSGENTEVISGRKRSAREMQENLTNGAPKYELIAFVSHMGANTHCGHYVCHVKRDGRWALFNDAKVAASDEVPMDMGYLYFYKRIHN